MGARLSQSNIYAISTLVTTEEWDIENILRRFERRRARWAVQESNGKLIEVIPHHANADEPEFLIADDVSDAAPPAVPPAALPVNPSTPAPQGGPPDDASSSRLSLSLASSSPPPSGRRNSPRAHHQERERAGERDSHDFGGSTSVSPLPSVYEGDQDGPHYPLDAAADGVEEPEGGTGRGGAISRALPSAAAAASVSSFPPAALPASYMVTRAALEALLATQKVSSSDCELVLAFFSLVDARGGGEVRRGDES